MNRFLDTYALYMEEIKKRTDVVTRLYQQHAAGHTMTGYLETDIDLIYLQLRKITELVMFACVVANKSAGLTLNKVLRKGYELKKIKNELRKFNTDFFPTPKKEDSPVDGIRKVSDFGENDRPFMAEKELFEVYGTAGNFLHAQRDYQYGDQSTKERHLIRALDQTNKIVALLNHHWTKISKDSFLAVVMSGAKDGKAHVSYMVPVKSKSST